MDEPSDEIRTARAIVLVRTLHRRYPRMIYLWEAVECVYCRAEPGQPCQTKLGRSADSSHSQRIQLYRNEVR
jgi:hypothetical protein